MITRRSDPTLFIVSGERLDARLSSRLLESIFVKESPLHDGAVIIEQDRIKMARCVLPVSKSAKFPTHLGMRHRSALGITESTDAIAIVVSEETGEISVAQERRLTQSISLPELKRLLDRELAEI